MIWRPGSPIRTKFCSTIPTTTIRTNTLTMEEGFSGSIRWLLNKGSSNNINSKSRVTLTIMPLMLQPHRDRPLLILSLSTFTLRPAIFWTEVTLIRCGKRWSKWGKTTIWWMSDSSRWRTSTKSKRRSIKKINNSMTRLSRHAWTSLNS